jgi:uncharacterized protein YodC (DUF2158 family)
VGLGCRALQYPLYPAVLRFSVAPGITSSAARDVTVVQSATERGNRNKQMAKFKSGDAVQLKSGGPKMTVTRPTDYKQGHYECKWFAGSKLNEGTFAEDELQPYQEEKKKAQK